MGLAGAYSKLIIIDQVPSSGLHQVAGEAPEQKGMYTCGKGEVRGAVLTPSEIVLQTLNNEPLQLGALFDVWFVWGV